MPKGWKKVKLGEVVEIGSSKRIFYKEYVDRGIPFYRSKEIIEKHNKQEISTALFITEEKYNEINNKFSVPQEWVGLFERVRQNTSIDWTIKENVRAKLRVIVKRTLRHYGYPPDMQKLATETVLKQAELIADEIINN